MRPQPKFPLASSANTILPLMLYDFSHESLFSHIPVHVRAKDRRGENKTKQMMRHGPDQEALVGHLSEAFPVINMFDAHMALSGPNFIPPRQISSVVLKPNGLRLQVGLSNWLPHAAKPFGEVGRSLADKWPFRDYVSSLCVESSAAFVADFGSKINALTPYLDAAPKRR